MKGVEESFSIISFKSGSTYNEHGEFSISDLGTEGMSAFSELD